jgi:hypothetical protein
MKYLVLLLNLFLLLATMAWGVTDTFTVTQTRPMGVLDRDSVAYMAGTEYAADTQRTTSGLVVSTSDGTLVTGGGVGRANVVPQCVAGGNLYGIEGNLTYGVSARVPMGSRGHARPFAVSLVETATRRAICLQSTTKAKNVSLDQWRRVVDGRDADSDNPHPARRYLRCVGAIATTGRR